MHYCNQPSQIVSVICNVQFVDEYYGSGAQAGQLKRTIPFPTTQSGNQMACTLTAHSAAHEGFASISADGKVLLVGCYNLPVGSTLTYQSSAQRVIARLFGNVSIDTSIYLTDALQSPSVFTSVVSTDGISQFWVSGSQYTGSDTGTVTPQPAGASGGVRFSTGGTTSVSIYNQYAVNALTLFNGNLYVAKPWSNGGGDAD
jgi:hypothetical protein